MKKIIIAVLVLLIATPVSAGTMTITFPDELVGDIIAASAAKFNYQQNAVQGETEKAFAKRMLKKVIIDMYQEQMIKTTRNEYLKAIEDAKLNILATSDSLDSITIE